MRSRFVKLLLGAVTAALLCAAVAAQSSESLIEDPGPSFRLNKSHKPE